MKKMMMILALLFAMVGSGFGGSWHSPTKINTIWVADGTNYGFRVYTNTGMYFSNEADSNYKTKVAVLLSAFQNKQSVKLFVEPVGSYFNIVEIQVLPN